MCKNCERPIEVSKFRMHDAQCSRLNYKCKECGMVVPKKEKEEHEATEHVKVKCQYCPFEEIQSKFNNHEDSCKMRPKPCQYCQEMQKFEAFTKHEEACGVKTRKCDTCQRWVKNRDWKKHPDLECKKFVAENEAKEREE